MYGLTLIAVLAVMGGAIAYIGDKLGTKVGKKKLTMFGLRPKHTSIVVTIITGILIAASTLGILALVSNDVRTALFGMEAVKAELAGLAREVTAKTAELETAKTELDAKTKEYSALNLKVAETAEQLNKISAELTDALAERDRTAAALAVLQADYTSAQQDLTKSRADIQALQTVKTELDGRVAALTAAKAGLESDVNRLKELTENLRKNVQIVREGAIVYRAGEVLATAVLPGGENRADTERALGEAVYKANRIILDKLDVEDKQLEVLWIAKAEFEQAVDILMANPMNVIVRISASGNTVYGEPVIGHIELFPNRLVYRQGETVCTQTVEVHNSREAEQVVLNFLQQVNQASVRQGILPDPLQGTVGSMSGSQLFETVNKVKKYSGKIQITATAQKDIYTLGPVTIDIQVRSLP